VDHLRSTATLPRRFGAEFDAPELTEALGWFHDVGKAAPNRQAGLLRAEADGGRVGVDHKTLGARLLAPMAGPAALAILGHQDGLTSIPVLRDMTTDVEHAATETVVAGLLPELQPLLAARPLLPQAWRGDRSVCEMGIRLAFSAPTTWTRRRTRTAAADIAAEVAEQRQALAAVNTVGDARTLHALVVARTATPVYHLSTRMTPEHRRDVLNEVVHGGAGTRGHRASSASRLVPRRSRRPPDRPAGVVRLAPRVHRPAVRGRGNAFIAATPGLNVPAPVAR
jgi:CRISPR-associated endonuclease/helicase Cas3